jgi:predicted nucleotidyltransferase
MDKNSVLKIIAQFKDAMENQKIAVQRIILFGSWAYGTPHEWSDIDLIVISESFKEMSYWERIKVVARAVYKVFEPIEATALTPDEWESGEYTIVDYARQGETVFAA